MAFVLPIVIEAVVGAATAASTAYGFYNAVTAGSPSAPPTTGTPMTAPPSPAQTPATNQAQQAAVTQSLPNLQALTGGSLSPEYAAQYGAGITGLGGTPGAAGNIQAAINQFFGLTAPGSTGLTPQSSGAPGGTSIVDMLARAIPAGGGGGEAGSPVAGQILNDEFRGYALA